MPGNVLHWLPRPATADPEYKEQQEAAEAKMYLKSEPVLLDNFIEELKDLDSGITDVAKLVCI